MNGREKEEDSRGGKRVNVWDVGKAITVARRKLSAEGGKEKM